jgi:excisionase family DNA binding protein
MWYYGGVGRMARIWRYHVIEEQQGTGWLTVAQVSERLQISQETVRRWIRSGDLPVLELGGLKAGYRIREDALAAFIDERYGPLKSAA